MKIIISLFVVMSLFGCSEKQVQEFAFRKALEISLIDLCEEEKKCENAVESQIKACMEKSDWYTYMQNEENEDELNRFTKEFYACVVDENGSPFFAVN